MKKFLVIGNPIDHSLSPNYTIIGLKKIILKLSMKKKLNENDLKNINFSIKEKKNSWY